MTMVVHDPIIITFCMILILYDYNGINNVLCISCTTGSQVCLPTSLSTLPRTGTMRQSCFQTTVTMGESELPTLTHLLHVYIPTDWTLYTCNLYLCAS